MSHLPPHGGGTGLVPDESIEFLGTIEIDATLDVQEEREINIPKPETTTLVPFNSPMIETIPTRATVSQDNPKLVRDSIADRKGLRKTIRLIKSERPLYPQVARKAGWEGTVVLRITIGADGDVGKVTTQTSSGFPALDESATQSVKTWQFDSAKDGEFPVSAAVDLPIRFDLEKYGIPSLERRTRT